MTGAAFGQASVIAIYRYPVKSMLGEELMTAVVTDRGVCGDRAYALVDVETGMVASAKNPRRWPDMFEFRAGFAEPADRPGSLPAARIAFPEGTSVTTGDPGLERNLSARFGRRVRLAGSAPHVARAENYSPDYEWLEQPDQVSEFSLPPGTFFDCASVHLITTATLNRLRALAPQGRFEVPRFRPNFVIEVPAEAQGFVENEWIGRTLSIGSEVCLRVEQPCPRCVMTTLSQGDLPKDPTILRTAVKHNEGNVGVYASVVQGGRVQRGDAVSMR
jgi:uncharacterized protein YcbX